MEKLDGMLLAVRVFFSQFMRIPRIERMKKKRQCTFYSTNCTALASDGYLRARNAAMPAPIGWHFCLLNAPRLEITQAVTGVVREF